MSLVYLHTNKITQQKYVGITNYGEAEKRWREGKGYETQYFGKAGIGVYGWDGFDHQVLVNDVSPAIAGTLECLLIKELETTNPKYGYNTSEGKIFPEALSQAKEIFNKVVNENPFILRRTSVSSDVEYHKPFTLDPVIIKTVKAGTTISQFSIGAVAEYFNYISHCCLINEKTNTSFLICNSELFAIVDKGQITTYPFESSYINGQTDKYDDKLGAWRYKTVEITDNNSIKPTIIITGTIANMKEFPLELIKEFDGFAERRRVAEEAERQRKAAAEQARLNAIAEKQRQENAQKLREYKAAQEAERQKLRMEKKAKRKAKFKRMFDFLR